MSGLSRVIKPQHMVSGDGDLYRLAVSGSLGLVNMKLFEVFESFLSLALHDFIKFDGGRVMTSLNGDWFMVILITVMGVGLSSLCDFA